MKFGVAIPTCMEGIMVPTPFCTLEQTIEISQRAEEWGFHSVWANDHFTAPGYVREQFPTPPNFYDPFITLAGIAARTRRIQVATGIAMLSVREPAITAKQLATLDVLSGGRAVLGVGIGAYREEFEAVRPQQKGANRGLMVEERIEALRLLMSGERVSYKGTYDEFEGVEMHPKPVQNPLPIYVGGNSPQVMERAARLGQGWIPVGQTPESLAERVAKLRELVAAAGRNPDEVEVAPQLGISIAETREEAREAYLDSQLYRHRISLQKSTLKGQDVRASERFTLIGSPGDIVARLREYRDAGAQHITGLIFAVATVEEMLQKMELFAREVIPAFAEDQA